MLYNYSIYNKEFNMFLKINIVLFTLLSSLIFTACSVDEGSDTESEQKSKTELQRSGALDGVWFNDDGNHTYLLTIVEDNFLWIHEGDPLFDGWSEGFEVGSFSLNGDKSTFNSTFDAQVVGGLSNLSSARMSLSNDILTIAVEDNTGQKVSTQLTQLKSENARVGIWLDDSEDKTAILILTPKNYALFSEDGTVYGVTLGDYTLTNNKILTTPIKTMGTLDFTLSGDDSAIFENAALIVNNGQESRTFYKVHQLNGKIAIDGLTYDWAGEKAYFQGAKGTTVPGGQPLTPSTDIIDFYAKVYEDVLYLRWDLAGNFTFPHHPNKAISDYNIFLRVSNDNTCYAEGKLVHIRTHSCSVEGECHNDFRLDIDTLEQVIKGGLVEIAVPLTLIPSGSYMNIDAKATATDDEASSNTDYYDLIDAPKCMKIR